jgi:hypothetical protein
MIGTRPLWKKLRIFLLICLLVFIALQFIRPPLDNPPVTADLAAPPQVKAILQRACYDCHSNETHLAWFDQPAPAYWLVVRDVKEGRRVLNFSNFDSLPKGVQAAKLFECIMQVEQGAMPLSQYTMLHHGGKIDAAEMEVLKQYAVTLGYHPKMDTARQRALAEQYAQWTGTGGATGVKDEYNGIAYGPLAGFADWKAVSTTERYDNGTFRLILGNDITAKAIREGHTNPWPDGATFAKVAWDQLPDSSGEIHAGAYKQVEFMIRDSKKYASTFGWGWARWVGGLALKPYGKEASFVEECMNCHRPVEKFDHTFTIPLADTMSLYDQAASLPDSVAKHPLGGKVIATIVNPKEGTMSTLYGNDLAVKSARKGQPYPGGAFLSLVTWRQRDDPHWFGGRIPKGPAAIETVSFDSAGNPYYNRRLSLNEKKPPLDSVDQRLPYITGLKASVLPRS